MRIGSFSIGKQCVFSANGRRDRLRVPAYLPPICGLVYTEMVSAKAPTMATKNKQDACGTRGGEALCCPDFLAAIRIMAQMASAAAGTGASLLDINMGCPAPKIVNNGEGSALMKDIDKIYRIVSAVNKASSVSVTVKLRKGFDEAHCNALEAAKAAQAGGAAAVTVHGGTREQYYCGKADWDVVGAVKAALTSL